MWARSRDDACKLQQADNKGAGNPHPHSLRWPRQLPCARAARARPHGIFTIVIWYVRSAARGQPELQSGRVCLRSLRLGNIFPGCPTGRKIFPRCPAIVPKCIQEGMYSTWHWTRLDQAGPAWTTLARLDHPGPHWTRLDHTGPGGVVQRSATSNRVKVRLRHFAAPSGVVELDWTTGPPCFLF